MFLRTTFKAALSSLLLTASFSSYAMDGTAYTATAFIILVLGGFILMNLVLNGLFFFAGKYQSKRFSKTHTIVSLILPVVALIWTVVDHVGFADLALNIGLIIVAIGLALLPIQLSLHQRSEHSYTSLILSIGSLAFLGLSYLIQPIAIFAIVAAHVSLMSKLNSDKQANSARIFAFTSLAISYPVLAYWLYQTAQVIASL